MQRSILPAILANALSKQAAAGFGMVTGNPYNLPNPFRSNLLTPIPKTILTGGRSVWSGQQIKPRPGPHSDISNPQVEQAPKLGPASSASLAKNYPWAVMYQNPRDPEGEVQKAVSGN